MTDDTSPWPERRRTQALLFAAGALFLLPAALSLGGLATLGGGNVVLATTVATALLTYGLLGWAGTWVEESAAEDVDEPRSSGDREPETGEEDPADADADARSASD